MVAKVFYTDMHTEQEDGLLKKFDRLVRASELKKIDMDKKFVAIKTHVGEYGNVAYLRPNFIKILTDFIKERGGIPFITDCSTLYPGMRKNAVEHLRCAELDGFNSVTCGCPLIIGDGLKGLDDKEIPVEDGVYVKTAKIGSVIADADIIITMNHFKGHELTGIGGAVKNLGMGCASRRGKFELHDGGQPIINQKKCIKCGKCAKFCAQNAITIGKKGASIDQKVCAGCGRCISICAQDAISHTVAKMMILVNEKIAEYTKAVLAGKPNYHFSFAMDVAPQCDCHGSNDDAIVPNFGIFGSSDAFAIDLACTEMAEKQIVIPGTMTTKNRKGKKAGDLFNDTNPGTDWKLLFNHAKKIGMGDAKYTIVNVK